MAKDLKDACEPEAPLPVILKKAEKVVPPPPPPPPKIVPIVIPKTIIVDNRTEIEKAYDRASIAITNETAHEEKMEEEHKEKIADIANHTLNANSTAQKDEEEKKEQI